ncbi:MAG TPA: hypothetical protein VH816_06950 [Gaiellaceae bacterium]|jgi:hypothetical protein
MHKLIPAAVVALALAATAVLAGGATARPAHGRASAVPLAQSLAAMRVATAKYATNLNKAKADGYRIITPMIPDMGIHYMNAKITGFDVTRPPILVYQKHGSQYLLGAVEWVFPAKPAKPPLPGAKYGAFGAACHYVDGTFVPAAAQADCAKTSPESGAAFGFWHPNLVTFHVWLWFHNPAGIYSGTNPLVSPFNET